jgi:molybdate transport system ATP-binding protein
MISLQNIKTVLADFALGEISLEIAAGQYFVLLGPTGAGKTVLLETIAGLHRPTAGRVLLDSRDITHLPLHQRRLGMVFQRQYLFGHLNVYDNIAYALRIGRCPRGEITQQVNAIAQELNINKLFRQLPNSLSGGERQRVALARTLITQPTCLLLDEPLSAIDAAGKDQMRHLLKSLQHKHHLTVLHVTHDFEDALALADHIGVMNKGQLVETGTCAQLFTRPNTHFVADFLGGDNLFGGTVESHNGQNFFVTAHNRFIVPALSFTGLAYIFIHPQDIVLSRKPLVSSARNSIAGTVSAIQPQPAGTATVQVDTGDVFRVTVLSRTVTEMDLKMGEPVYVTFKSSGTHLLAHCED